MKYLEDNELASVNGGSFAYDVGAVIGFIGRMQGPGGFAHAYIVWQIQYAK